MEFEKDICGDPRIQPGSLVSLSSMSKDVFVDELGEISIALLAHIFLKKKMVHTNTRISYRIITCMVVALPLPLPNHLHFWASVSVNIICI